MTENLQVASSTWVSNAKELKAAGVPVLHYYTLGKPQVIKNVCKSLF
jgi:methylenetetrahydrofolate reductase (NADPH)